MKTAVEFLANVLSQSGQITEDDFNSLVEQAKEMEKQQIINAWIATDNELQRISAEQYYKETFKQQEQ